jgi:hypothetical protein
MLLMESVKSTEPSSPLGHAFCDLSPFCLLLPQAECSSSCITRCLVERFPETQAYIDRWEEGKVRGLHHGQGYRLLRGAERVQRRKYILDHADDVCTIGDLLLGPHIEHHDEYLPASQKHAQKSARDLRLWYRCTVSRLMTKSLWTQSGPKDVIGVLLERSSSMRRVRSRSTSSGSFG